MSTIAPSTHPIPAPQSSSDDPFRRIFMEDEASWWVRGCENGRWLVEQRFKVSAALAEARAMMISNGAPLEDHALDNNPLELARVLQRCYNPPMSTDEVLDWFEQGMREQGAPTDTSVEAYLFLSVVIHCSECVGAWRRQGLGVFTPCGTCKSKFKSQHWWTGQALAAAQPNVGRFVDAWWLAMVHRLFCPRCEGIWHLHGSVFDPSCPYGFCLAHAASGLDLNRLLSPPNEDDIEEPVVYGLSEDGQAAELALEKALKLVDSGHAVLRGSVPVARSGHRRWRVASMDSIADLDVSLSPSFLVAKSFWGFIVDGVLQELNSIGQGSTTTHAKLARGHLSTGKLRLVIDYTRLNRRLTPIPFALRRLDLFEG